MSGRLSPSGRPFWGARCQGGGSPRPRAGLQPALPCADHHLRRCPACPAASPVSWLHLGEVVTPTLPSPDVTDLSGDVCAEPPAESPEPRAPPAAGQPLAAGRVNRWSVQAHSALVPGAGDRPIAAPDEMTTTILEARTIRKLRTEAGHRVVHASSWPPSRQGWPLPLRAAPRPGV